VTKRSLGDLADLEPDGHKTDSYTSLCFLGTLVYGSIRPLSRFQVCYQKARNRRRVNTKEPSGISRCFLARGDHLDHLPSLAHGELGASAANSPLSAGALQSGTGALTDHLALELGETADHLHHHTAGRRCRRPLRSPNPLRFWTD